ncbi:hypothetical protein C7974DRAFT_235957 [Boeremia exigua]|uniref:uncharacterized protein n=1 Tax=Boeremia exigua TaxID=749465 RepID=UPI001E8E12DB|nr:uncharacterized protein C7974DRAFT_235957 [Boeremia exigua]KAH6620548.1 hypothetical protein C7974DRAFT_235957 [Boeremia exigua]
MPYVPRSVIEWAFLVVAATQAISTSALDIVILLRFLSWVKPEVYQVPGAYVVPVNFAVFVLGNVYFAILAFDALQARNNLQLFGICAFNVGIFFFSLLRYDQTRYNATLLSTSTTIGGASLVKADVPFLSYIQPVLIVSTIVLGVCMLCSWILVFRLNHEFAWAIYRHVSGSLATRRKYLTYQILLVFMKLDIYFIIAFIIVYGTINVHWQIPEFPLTVAIIPLLIVQIGMTTHFTKRENRLGAIAAIVIRLGEIAYLLSRILVLHGVQKSSRSQTLMKNEMLFFAGCSLLLSTIACGNATLCLLNFGHGLKPLLMDSGWKQGRYEFQPIHDRGRPAARLELD